MFVHDSLLLAFCEDNIKNQNYFSFIEKYKCVFVAFYLDFQKINGDIVLAQAAELAMLKVFSKVKCDLLNLLRYCVDSCLVARGGNSIEDFVRIMLEMFLEKFRQHFFTEQFAHISLCITENSRACCHSSCSSV